MTSVVVDGRALSGYSAGRGIGTYMRGVLPALAQQPGIDLTVLATERDAVPAGVGFRRTRRRAPGRWQDREHDLLLPRDVRRVRDAHVLLSPALDPPRVSRLPWVQVLHDVIPLDHESFEGERERWQRYAPRFREAAEIIAVSRHCGDLAVELLDLDPARVTVAHHGVDPAFHPGPSEASDPYLLYVGEYDARKGYREACEVAALVADAGLPHTLKVAGFIAPWKRAEIEGVVAASRRPERVQLLGHVHHTEELPALMRGASVLTVTSRYEGFGLPAAEGMACGIPVVSFRNTSLTEVVGSGGLLIEDGDTVAFAEAVIGLLRDPASHAAVVASGLERARSFTWQNSAALHADVLRRASKEAP